MHARDCQERGKNVFWERNSAFTSLANTALKLGEPLPLILKI